jgi:two-component system LytT family response regulator
MKYTAIVADDEEVARKRIIRLVRACSDDVVIVAEASDGISASQLIDQHKPDLVFLDIQMPGLSGIDVAKKTVHKPFVIFVTAFNQFAIDAFKTLAIDYLLKPAEEEDIRKALEKFRALVRPVNGFEKILSDLSTRIDGKNRQKISLSTGDTIKMIDCDEIICFEAEHKYTTVYSKKGEYVTDMSLCDLEKILQSDQFVRIHRKHIVNFKYVDELSKWFDRRLKVKLTVPFKKELVVGRTYIDNVLKCSCRL